MEKRYAMQLCPVWSSDEPVKIHDEPGKNPKPPVRMRIEEESNKFIKRYGIFLVLMCLWTISMIICSAIASHRTEKAVRAEMAVEYAKQLEAYKQEQREQEQASYFLSGDASREAAINQEVDAVAGVISKLSTDAQKLTEASCMLARVLSPYYPNSFKEVALQPSQWMFFDGSDNTFSQHDRSLADKIVRPYMESGIVPDGLTADMVYGAWSQNDFVLRDSYQNSSTMHTWRYSS